MDKQKWRNLSGAFRGYLFSRRLRTADIVLSVLAGGLLLFCWFFSMPLSQVFTSAVDITRGYSAKQDEQGLYYAVDDAHSRLLCFDEAGVLRYTLDNLDDGKSGLYIEDFAVDGGRVYLSATGWDGMMLYGEVIALFDGNRRVRTIVEQDYSGRTVNKHRFHGLTVRDGVLSYVEADENHLTAHWLTLSDGSERTREIALDNAFNAVNDCAFSGGAVYVLAKNGTITAYDGEQQTLVYTTKWPGEESRVPYRLTVSADGDVYFTDVFAGEAVRVDSAGRRGVPVVKGTASQTVHLTADGGVMCLEEDALRVVSDAGEQTWRTLPKSPGRVAMQIVWLAAAAVLTILCLILLFRVALSFVSRKYETPQLIAFWVIGTVALVAAILCGMLLSSFSEIYTNRIKMQMENSARIVANEIPDGVISKLKRVEDFDSDAYKSICDLLEKAFPMDLDINRQVYCDVMRLSDDGERGFVVASLDQCDGLRFPLEEAQTEEVRQIYRADGGAAVWNDNYSDVSGTYLIVKVPIYENASVSGVVAVGMDPYDVKSMIHRLEVQILLSVVVIMMLIWVIISEVMAWFANLEIYRRGLARGRADTLPGHLVRLLVFIVFVCYDMSSTFLPVWILRNSEVFPESSREFLASLPMTVNIFVIGIMSLLTAPAMRRLGIWKIIMLSTSCSLAANLMMFLFPSYFTILFGLALDGVGVGLIVNATYILLTYVKRDRDRQWGFTIYNAATLSGVNFGLLLGSLLAVAIGQRLVFLTVAAMWLALMLLGFLALRQLSVLRDSKDEDEEEAEISFGRFLFNKPVLSFIVLFQNPYILFSSFVFYFVPLFCGNLGYDETIVSILIMAYSEVGALMGGTLTRRVSEALGSKGMYVAYLTNVAALMVFALTRNMLGVVLALLMMGTAAGYGKTLQQIWFLKQKQTRRYGEDRAMGIYNFTENIGESAAPAIFSSLMARRPLLGAVSAFCGGIVALGGAHFALNRRELKAAITKRELSKS